MSRWAVISEEKMHDMVSKLPQVSAWVRRTTAERAEVAEQRIVEHRATGAAKIESYVADVDGYIVLVDPNDPGNTQSALAVEFGRTGGGKYRRRVPDGRGGYIVKEYESTPSRGVHALGAALGRA